MSSSSNNNSIINSAEEQEELASPTTPSPTTTTTPTTNTYNDQLSLYREKHRVFKEKKKNQDMAALTGFLIASKYDSQTLTSSGLERYTPKVVGFFDNTPTNATRSKVSFRASNIRGRGLPTVQPGSWFKPSTQAYSKPNEQDNELAVKVGEESISSTTAPLETSLNNLSLKEEVVVSSSTGLNNNNQTGVPVRRL